MFSLWTFSKAAVLLSCCYAFKLFKGCESAFQWDKRWTQKVHLVLFFKKQNKTKHYSSLFRPLPLLSLSNSALLWFYPQSCFSMQHTVRAEIITLGYSGSAFRCLVCSFFFPTIFSSLHRLLLLSYFRAHCPGSVLIVLRLWNFLIIGPTVENFIHLFLATTKSFCILKSSPFYALKW